MFKSKSGGLSGADANTIGYRNRLTRSSLPEGLWTLLLLTMTACATSSPTISTEPDAEKERNRIIAQSREFSDAYVRGDVKTLVSFYDDEAVIAPPRRSFISGRNGLTRFWTTKPGIAVVAHKTTPIDIVVVGDIAYDWGYYEGAMGPEGSPEPFSGKYLIVWRKDDDGSWRMTVDMWNRK